MLIAIFYSKTVDYGFSRGSQVHLDLVGPLPLPSSHGFTYLLTMIDREKC